MARIPRDPDPFFKWDPDGANARARADARAAIDGKPERRTSSAPLKRWMLRWAWAISTGMLVLGYAIMALLLSGHGDWMGL